MSKKRTSAEASKDEQTSEGSDSVVQQEDNAKRAKLTLLSDTTLQDLPMELIECILVKAVAMEVKGMKLAKSVWKEKADLVINRLRTVCSQWNSILTTNFFRNEVHRTLDRTAQGMIRMEILHQSPIQSDVLKAATLKDEMFMMCGTSGRDCVIKVYDRNNMAEVKAVIALPGINAENMMSCSVSNCLYVVNVKSRHCLSLLRITKDEKHQFNISPWISDIQYSFSCNPVSLTVNGSLIIISNQRGGNPTVISIYCANRSIQHKLMLPPDIYGFYCVDGAIQKSNGNLVLVSYTDVNCGILKLLEIDMTGSIARQYQPCSEICDAIFTDSYDRILLTGPGPSNQYELLDSEFNPMDFTGLKLQVDEFLFASDLSYNSETNEAVIILEDEDSENRVLTIFRFTKE